MPARPPPRRTSMTVAARRAAGTETECAHCGLPVPPGLRVAGAEHQFCCSGCLTAWTIIHDAGLEGYYRIEERRGARVEPSGRRFEEFDHPAFEALYVRTRPDGLRVT